MHFLRDSRDVLVLLCVLVSSSHALREVKNGSCDVFIQDVNNLTLNCSRRDIDKIPNWPEQLNNISDKDGHVLITFFSNDIRNVTQLQSVPGTRVAISFKSNRIVEIEDDAFRNIEKLVYLDLSNNFISGEVLRSEIFQGPYRDGVYKSIALETLNLGYNEIHSLDRYLFQYTPNLTRLYLNNNPIEILDHVTILALSSATNLEVLDLSKTEIDNIPLDAFKGLANLRQIDLSGNQFVTVPESLSIVGNTLQYLTFNDNPIVELTDDSFVGNSWQTLLEASWAAGDPLTHFSTIPKWNSVVEYAPELSYLRRQICALLRGFEFQPNNTVQSVFTGLTNLLELEVGENNYLEEVKRSTFSPLKNLRVLHLCHNRNLRYISHNAFRTLKDKWTLKEVYLDENNLSELSTDLMPWRKLDVLGMTGNNWLCNCDLDNIVTKQGAGTRFKTGEIPYCTAPMRLSGAYITNITVSFCPTFDITIVAEKRFSFSDLRPKHILWSILGVAGVVVIGMLCGLIVNATKAIYKRKLRSQSIRYIHVSNSSFA